MANNRNPNRTLYIDIIESISQSIIDDFAEQIEDCYQRGINTHTWRDEMHAIANETVQTMAEALTESYRNLHPELFKPRYKAHKWSRKHHGWGVRPSTALDEGTLDMIRVILRFKRFTSALKNVMLDIE
jgi:DNA-binding cell septation regulator SpoVG